MSSWNIFKSMGFSFTILLISLKIIEVANVEEDWVNAKQTPQKGFDIMHYYYYYYYYYFTACKFFTPALVGGISLKSELQ